MPCTPCSTCFGGRSPRRPRLDHAAVGASSPSGEYAFLEWSADGKSEVHDGADCYVVREGLIVMQTIHSTRAGSRVHDVPDFPPSGVLARACAAPPY